MKTRTLGRTGLQVSEISFGAVEIGLAYGIPVEGKIEKPSEQEAHAVLNAALDMGINFVDTARAYGDSEEIIGRNLKSRRKEYILATKTLHYGDKGLSVQEQKQAVRDSIETSLKALQTDVIDVMQVHNITQEVVERGDVLEVLQEAQRAGKVRFLGGSVYGVEDPLAVIRDGHYDVLQVAYNMIDHRLDGEVLPLALQKGVAITTRSVLLKGALTPRYLYLADNLGELKATIAEMERLVAGECGSLAEAAFRYVLSNPAVSSALVGTSKVKNLERSVEYTTKGPLSPRLTAALRAIELKDMNQLNPGTWGYKEKYSDK
jgi:aryl-alcohol dehydrogenase-like predicted oxidoreductase